MHTSLVKGYKSHYCYDTNLICHVFVEYSCDSERCELDCDVATNSVFESAAPEVDHLCLRNKMHNS